MRRFVFLLAALALVASACSSTTAQPPDAMGGTTGSGTDGAATATGGTTGGATGDATTGGSGSKKGPKAIFTDEPDIRPTGKAIPFLRPPDAGRYVYDILSRSPGDTLDRLFFDFEEPRRDADGWRQEMLIHEPGTRDGAMQDKLWSSAEVLVEEVTLIQKGDRSRCRVQPPLVEMHFPLEVGGAWENPSATRCPALESGSLSFKVLGTEPVPFDGKVYTTYVIEQTTRAQTSSGEPYELVRRAWFSPDLRVNLKQEAGRGTTPMRLLILEDIRKG